MNVIKICAGVLLVCILGLVALTLFRNLPPVRPSTENQVPDSVRSVPGPSAPSGWYGRYDSETKKTHKDICVWIGPEGVAKVRVLVFDFPATWQLQKNVLFVDYINVEKDKKQNRYMLRGNGSLFDIDTETEMKPFEE
jgi:hypothetical protein